MSDSPTTRLRNEHPAAGELSKAQAAAPRLRAGRSSDLAAVLGLWDDAIAWLVARGQAGQWGSEPASARADTRTMAREWVQRPGLTIAQLDKQVVGMSVIVDSHPDYVASIEESESYLLGLISSRDHIGHGIGARLVRRAAEDAIAARRDVLRVDCWADAPDLVAWYERLGFTRSQTFCLDGWRGQVLEMAL